MHVPAEVESGSVPFVILDCDYDLAESESNQVKVHSRFDFFYKVKDNFDNQKFAIFDYCLDYMIRALKKTSKVVIFD